MGDVQHGQAQLQVEPLQLDPHVLAQAGVEVGQRLVEQQQRRMAHDGAGHRHPLLLPAGQLVRIAVDVLLHPHRPQGLGDPLAALAAGHLAVAQREGDVGGHAHVGPHRVRLEHHRQVPPLGLDQDPALGVVDHLAADGHRAAGRRLDPGEDPQDRGLAAAARPQEGHELPCADREADSRQRGDRAEGLVEAVGPQGELVLRGWRHLRSNHSLARSTYHSALLLYSASALGVPRARIVGLPAAARAASGYGPSGQAGT